MLQINLIAITFLLSLRITDVEVNQNIQYTEDEIESMIFDSKWSANPLYLYYEYSVKEHKAIPYVEDYEIVFKDLNSVEIIVNEISAVGCVFFGSSYMNFDKEGIIIGSTKEKLDGIPQVTGLEFDNMIVDQTIKAKVEGVLEDTLNLIEVLSIYGIQADKIHYSSDLEPVITIKNLEIKTGDNSEINGKIAELNDILKEYQDLNGTLYLNTYDGADPSPNYRLELK